MATEAEYHKCTKYRDLDSVYLFVPLAMADQLEDSRIYSFLLQHVGAKVQWGNVVVAMVGSLSLFALFYLCHFIVTVFLLFDLFAFKIDCFKWSDYLN